MSEEPASTKVLTLPELLELIIEQLDTKTLFHAVRVCKLWQRIITTAPPASRIQETLFLQPSATPAEWLICANGTPKGRVYAQEYNKSGDPLHHLLGLGKKGVYNCLKHLNPLLFATKQSAKIPISDLRLERRDLFRLKLDHNFPVSDLGRRMFVCQPPCSEMWLKICKPDSMGNAAYYGSVRLLKNVNGTTVSQVLKSMKSMEYHGKWMVGRAHAFAEFYGLPVSEEEREMLPWFDFPSDNSSESENCAVDGCLSCALNSNQWIRKIA
jgi:hypothetical protein